MTDNVVEIDYYTDVLCVWAWIAQRRIEELQDELGRSIHLRHHYIDLFGDTATRIHAQWNDRGSYDGFAQHVAESASPFDTAPINPKVWHEVRPVTSANAHLLIKAVEIDNGPQIAAGYALAIRRAFFVDARDIGDQGVLFDIANDLHLRKEQIDQCLADGSAIAHLMADHQLAASQSIKGSPSYVLNEGRQVLYGNVGYRVLAANIEELLNRPQGEASWC